MCSGRDTGRPGMTRYAGILALLTLFCLPGPLNGSEIDRLPDHATSGGFTPLTPFTSPFSGSSYQRPQSPGGSYCAPRTPDPSGTPQQSRKHLARKRKKQIKKLAQSYVPNGNLTIMNPGAIRQGRNIKNPWTLETSHYKIRTDISRKATGEIALIMELLFHSFIQSPVFNVNERNLDKLTVEVPKNRTEFVQLVSPYTKVSKQVRGLYLKGTRNNKLVAYYFHSNRMKLNNVLLHEGTHQFIDLVTRSRLPIWLEEGLATYFEFSRFQNMKLVEGALNKSRLRNVRALLRQDKALALSELMRLSNKQFQARHYAQVWSFIHFLIHSNDGKFISKLRKYFSVYKQPGVKQDPVQLFKKIFKVHPDKFQPYWKRYVFQLGK